MAETSRPCSLALPSKNHAPGEERAPLRRQIVEGLRFVGRDSYLRPMVTWGAVINMALMGYQAVQVVFLVRTVGLNPAMVGLMLTSGSAGGIVGALLAAGFTRRFGTARGLLLLQAATAPFALLVPMTTAGPEGPGQARPYGAGGYAEGLARGRVTQARPDTQREHLALGSAKPAERGAGGSGRPPGSCPMGGWSLGFSPDPGGPGRRRDNSSSARRRSDTGEVPMNPEERQELARLVPSPGDPVLTSDRYDLLKDHLMREITPQVQNTFDIQDVQGVQDARPTATVATPRRTAARPGRRFAVIAVPLAAVVTAAVVIGTGITDTRTTDPEAVDLLNRIATVAAAKKAVPVRDDHVYIRTQNSLKITDKDIRIFRDSRWTAVDGKRPGLSRITVLQGPPPRPRDPFSSYAKGTRDMTLYADPNVSTFREMEALPNDPDALLKKIYADSKGERQTRQSVALETIGDMLDDATLLPELDAALYRAAAKIPGVSVVENAKDLAGRSGIGLSFKSRDGRDVWVFDKKSLTYLGSDKEALLDTGVTDKRGKEPSN